MPNKNGTGPEGKGPKTGRGLGNCGADKSADEKTSFGRRQSRGSGQGQARGQGNQNRNRGNS